jgi:hypothetical protein
MPLKSQPLPSVGQSQTFRCMASDFIGSSDRHYVHATIWSLLPRAPNAIIMWLSTTKAKADGIIK